MNSLDEPESSSMRTENAPSLSDRDFTELSEKVEKSVSKRIKDTEVGQREILKMIENLTSKIDTLAERPPNNMRHDPDVEDAGNTDYRFRTVEPSDLLPNHGQHTPKQGPSGCTVHAFRVRNLISAEKLNEPVNALAGGSLED